MSTSGLKVEIKVDRPPLGVKPRDLHVKSRCHDLLQAMERYIIAGKPIPREWLLELSDLYGGD